MQPVAKMAEAVEPLLPMSTRPAHRSLLIGDGTGDGSANSLRPPWLSAVLGALVSALIMVVMNISCATVVFQAVPEHLSQGATLCLLGSAAFPAALLLTTSTEIAAPWTSDSFFAALFAQAASSLRAAGVAAPFGTVVVSMALSSVLIGILLAGLGLSRIGRAAQFVPAPVMAGFLASMGFVQLDATCRMIAGCSLISLHQHSCPPYVVSQLVAAFVGGAAMYASQEIGQACKSNLLTQGAMPLSILAAVVGFQVAKLFVSDDAIAAWSLDLPAGDALTSIPAALDLGKVHWLAAARESLPATLAASVPSVIQRLLAMSAHELHTNEVLEMSEEITRFGTLQALAAPLSLIVPPMFSLPTMIVADTLGASGKLVPATSALVSLLIAIIGPGSIAVAPTALFAAVLASIGFRLSLRELTAAWISLGLREFVLVVAHVIVAAYFGMAAAVGFGLLASALIFSWDYGQYSGVLQTASAELERSSVVRPANEQALLASLGASTLIIHLRGMLLIQLLVLLLVQPGLPRLSSSPPLLLSSSPLQQACSSSARPLRWTRSCAAPCAASPLARHLSSCASSSLTVSGATQSTRVRLLCSQRAAARVEAHTFSLAAPVSKSSAACVAARSSASTI